MTYIDSFSLGGGLSVSFDGYGGILIVLPSLDALRGRAVVGVAQGFESRLSSLAARDDVGLLGRLRDLREQFFTAEGREEVLSHVRVFDAIRVVTATPHTVLAVTVVEADGDIISRVNEAGAYAYSEELFRLHGEAVKYATGSWRTRLQRVRDLLRLGAKVHRALLLVSMGSLVGSAAAWTLDRVLTAAFLGLGGPVFRLFYVLQPVQPLGRLPFMKPCISWKRRLLVLLPTTRYRRGV